MLSSSWPALLGGPGSDVVGYAGYTEAVVIDADGVKGDDGQAGEHDTIGADVESLFGGSGNDRITAYAGDGSLDGGDYEKHVVDLLNGGSTAPTAPTARRRRRTHWSAARTDAVSQRTGSGPRRDGVASSSGGLAGVDAV